MKTVNPNITIGPCEPEKTPVFEDVKILDAFKCVDKDSVYIKTGDSQGICVRQGNSGIPVGSMSGFSANFKVIPATTEIKISF